MRLSNTLCVLANLSSEDSLPHNLGPKYRSEGLPYVTELYLGVEKSDCLKLYLELCSLKILQILLGHIVYFNFIHKNANVLQTSIHQSWQLGPF